MTDDDLMTAALDADEAFTARVRMFRILKRESDPVVRVVEHPRNPDELPNLDEPVDAGETVKLWDFGSEQMAKDFIKLQGWKAAAAKLLAPKPAASRPSILRPADTLEFVEQARAFVREKPSTSYMQRRMQIGYNHAAELMEKFEREGVVSTPNSAGLRTVLA